MLTCTEFDIDLSLIITNKTEKEIPPDLLKDAEVSKTEHVGLVCTKQGNTFDRL
jgi:hypothetical protein